MALAMAPHPQSELIADGLKTAHSISLSEGEALSLELSGRDLKETDGTSIMMITHDLRGNCRRCAEVCTCHVAAWNGVMCDHQAAAV